MKNFILKYPNFYRFVLAIILFSCALFISVLINKGAVKEYFPYTSAILLLVSSWILLKTDNKSLHNIGLSFKFKNLVFLPLGILIAACTFLVAKYFKALYFGETFHLSTVINYKNISFALYSILPTVAVEEFIFRGYLFKKTIEMSSVVKANIIFAALFTSIHVLDDGVLNGNPGMMILLIISIPVGHLLFATAFLKSKSLFFPIGLHLGNNWATRHLVTANNDNESIFYITDNITFETWPSFILFVISWNLLFLFVTFIIWKWPQFSFLKRLKKKV